MTRVDLHPEDLLDQLRAGELRADERARLHNHCESCSACAFERQLIESGADLAEPDELDHAIGARAMERMLSGDEVPVPVPVRPPARSHHAFRAAALAIAGVLVGVSVSAAALTGTSPFVFVELITAWVTPAPVAPSSQPTPVAPSTRRKQRWPGEIQAPPVAPLLLEQAPGVEPPVVAPVATIVEPSAGPIAAAPPISRHAVAQAARPDPATWFFRAASHARADGRYREALALYSVLQRDFAGSEVEVVARVAVGRLCLTQLNDATQALNAFESYLADRPAGPLAEEARSGRVGALRKLGREAEADAAMQDLIAHHPHSLYAAPNTPATP
jgi:hypothetical protein